MDYWYVLYLNMYPEWLPLLGGQICPPPKGSSFRIMNSLFHCRLVSYIYIYMYMFNLK